MTAKIIPFNPLEKKNLAASIAEALLASPAHPLGDIPPTLGAGIYAIYYSGKFQPYREIACRNQHGRKTAPIYVGKAAPAGARKGGRNVASSTTGKSLLNRLSEHAESIRSVTNLDIDDFTCRLLVIDDIWIPLGEQLLIAHYSPIWNALVDGFGNHDPGSGRYNGLRPRWDVLHPGRSWAMKCKERNETEIDIIRDVVTYLQNVRFPTSDRFFTSD